MRAIQEVAGRLRQNLAFRRRGPRVLIVGGRGREHALAWKIARDRPRSELFIAGGRHGLAGLATLVPVDRHDIDGLVRWCRAERPDLVVIGDCEPLEEGAVDALSDIAVRAFGPTAAAARIEWSKAYGAEVGAAAGIPMPPTFAFDSADAADAFVRAAGTPFVVKPDDVAASWGVTVCETVEATHAAIDAVARQRRHHSRGERVVLQQRVKGEEVSYFALCDGTTSRFLGAARDYKRLQDGDRGPNTDGIGAYSPVSAMTPRLQAEVDARIVKPVLAELRRRGTPFVGFLYIGLMLTDDGPTVLEFNARLGDPEAQVILPLIGLDLVDAMEAAIDGRLARLPASVPSGAAVCVVLAAGGYPVPEQHQGGMTISGLDADDEPGTIVFHAGTDRRGGQWIVKGRRVVCVTGLGATVAEARARAYRRAGTISFEHAVWRSDIGADRR